MELIEGPTLADRIAEGPIPLDESLKLARADRRRARGRAPQGRSSIATSSPRNIKIRPDGTVKVLDFGLAKVGGLADGRVGQLAHALGARDAGRRHAGHRRLHEPRAGQGKAGRQARRHLGLRRRAVRDAHRRAAASGRDPVGDAGLGAERSAGSHSRAGTSAAAATELPAKGPRATATRDRGLEAPARRRLGGGTPARASRRGGCGQRSQRCCSSRRWRWA